jgi:hypothetical protein
MADSTFVHMSDAQAYTDLDRCRTLHLYDHASTETARNVIILSKATVLQRKYIEK